MRPQFALTCLSGVLSILLGCAKTDDSRQAQRAMSGMMPGATPQYEAAYVADQGQVKILPVRQVSYEALETFAAAKSTEHASPAAEEGAEEAKPAPAAADENKAAKQKKPGEKGGVLKALSDKVKAASKSSAAKPAKADEKPKKTAPKEIKKVEPKAAGAGLKREEKTATEKPAAKSEEEKKADENEKEKPADAEKGADEERSEAGGEGEEGGEKEGGDEGEGGGEKSEGGEDRGGG